VYFITGGSLKTLEQADEESLQAAFYDVDDVVNSRINLRQVVFCLFVCFVSFVSKGSHYIFV
jgi:hypothetical protein